MQKFLIGLFLASGIAAGAGYIKNSDISSTAAIAWSKMAAQTASKVACTNGSGVLSTCSTSSANVAFLDATSSIQTQLDAKQSLAANLTALSGLTTAADKISYWTGSATAALTDLTSFARSLLDDSDAATARSTLGLGTIATQAANSVSITGGSVTGITDLAIADGGTGASSTTAAFNALAPCSTQGSVLYHNGTNWVCLGPGTSGQVLETQGTGANPIWADASASSERVERVNFRCNTSGSTVNSQSGSWVSSVSNGGAAGQCTVNFTASTFSSAPICVVSSTSTSTRYCSTGTPSTSSVSVQHIVTNAADDGNCSMICMGPR